MRTIDLQLAESEAIHQHRGVFPAGLPAKAREEPPSATLMVGEANMVQGASVVARSSLAPRHVRVWSVLAMQPTLVQASVVSAAAVFCLVFAQQSGRNLYDAWNPAPPNLTVITAGIVLIMATSLLGPWLHERVSQVRLMAMTGVLTAAGCGALEWAALHLPIASPPAADDMFIQGNLLVLVCAVVMGLSSALHAWRSAVVPRNPRQLPASPMGKLQE